MLGTAARRRRVALGPALSSSGPRAYAVTGRHAVPTGRPGGSVLVLLSLRGAADGLSLVVPHGDPAYYAARPRIGVPHTALLAPDAMFGLHPALAPLLPMWQAGTLAAVHATGMATPNRSHFAAMEAIEDAAPGSTERNGWLNRLLGELPGASPLQGTAMGNQVPTSLFGTKPGLRRRPGRPGQGRRHRRGRPPTARSRHAWKGNGRDGPAPSATRSPARETFGAARDLPGRHARHRLPRHRPRQGAVRRVAHRARRASAPR